MQWRCRCVEKHSRFAASRNVCGGGLSRLGRSFCTLRSRFSRMSLLDRRSHLMPRPSNSGLRSARGISAVNSVILTILS
jgi:hypothetical protein